MGTASKRIPMSGPLCIQITQIKWASHVVGTSFGGQQGKRAEDPFLVNSIFLAMPPPPCMQVFSNTKLPKMEVAHVRRASHSSKNNKRPLLCLATTQSQQGIRAEDFPPYLFPIPVLACETHKHPPPHPRRMKTAAGDINTRLPNRRSGTFLGSSSKHTMGTIFL